MCSKCLLVSRSPMSAFFLQTQLHAPYLVTIASVQYIQSEMFKFKIFIISFIFIILYERRTDQKSSYVSRSRVYIISYIIIINHMCINVWGLSNATVKNASLSADIHSFVLWYIFNDVSSVSFCRKSPLNACRIVWFRIFDCSLDINQVNLSYRIYYYYYSIYTIIVLLKRKKQEKKRSSQHIIYKSFAGWFFTVFDIFCVRKNGVFSLGKRI